MRDDDGEPVGSEPSAIGPCRRNRARGPAHPAYAMSQIRRSISPEDHSSANASLPMRSCRSCSWTSYARQLASNRVANASGQLTRALSPPRVHFCAVLPATSHASLPWTATLAIPLLSSSEPNRTGEARLNMPADRTRGAPVGVWRPPEDAMVKRKARDWSVVMRYEDACVSASSRRSPRTGRGRIGSHQLPITDRPAPPAPAAPERTDTGPRSPKPLPGLPIARLGRRMRRVSVQARRIQIGGERRARPGSR